MVCRSFLNTYTTSATTATCKAGGSLAASSLGQDPFVLFFKIEACERVFSDLNHDFFYPNKTVFVRNTTANETRTISEFAEAVCCLVLSNYRREDERFLSPGGQPVRDLMLHK